jgi:hypothetical protein
MPPFSLRGTDAVRYMSVHTGVQAAYRTDSHGHCPQNRLTCANQQAEPLPQAHPVRANVRRGKTDEPLTGGCHPHTEDAGIKECYSGTSNHDDRGNGAPLLAAEARQEELKNPNTAPALSAGTRYPHTASRWRAALPAKPARQRTCRPSW